MTYVTDQTSQELRAHMRRLKAMAGWNEPLADRLYKEILELDETVSKLRAAQAAQPLATQLGMAVVESIADDGNRNAAGGIYASSVQDFAVEVQRAFAEQNRVHVPGLTDDSAQTAQPAQMPAGYVLVPVEPTPEMLEEWLFCNGPLHERYAKMLTAVPAAPDTSQKEEI